MQNGDDDDSQSWLERWLKQDYSWRGLASKPSWTPDTGAKLQQFLRNTLHCGRTDDQLIADSVLIKCKKYGYFHPLFIPLEWTKKPKLVALDEPSLIEKQSAFWSALRASELRGSFSGTISGVHLPEKTEELLVNGTRASFAWTSFCGSLHGIPKRFDRSFYNCSFRNTVTLSEKVAEPSLPFVQFIDCELCADVSVSDLEGVREVRFVSCDIQGALDFSDICNPRIRIVGSYLRTFDSLGCEFQSEVDLFETAITRRFSLSRCAFEEPFSLVTVSLLKGIELLDCDFKARVTFSELSWPPPTQTTATAEGSKFYSTVSFSGDEPPPVQFFKNVEFGSSVAFSGIAEESLRTSFYAELAAPTNEDGERHAYPGHALALENGCRTLRKLAEDRGDIHQEHFWHRAEIIS